jgi:AbiV family abortive infection protein
MTRQHRPLPTISEARLGAIAAAANATDLLAAGKTLAENRHHGPAYALLVLACEEAVKARAMQDFYQDMHFGLTDDELSEIVYGDHRARHAAAFTLIVTDTTLKLVMGRIRRLTPLQQAQHRSDLNALAWLLTANALKQRGLYADLVDGYWQLPRDLTAEDVRRALKIVQPFVSISAREASLWID